MLISRDLQNARWDSYVGDVAPTDSKPSERVVFKISVSNIPLEKKPDKNTPEGRKLMGRLDKSFQPAELTAEEILDKILRGFSISNIVWNGDDRVSENFKQFQIFILDFDNDLFFKKGIGPNVTPEMFVERLRNRGLDCSYILTSLSDSPERRKFRVLFFSDEVCSNPAKAKLLFKGLAKEFDGDTSTTGLAQFFFPGKHVSYVNPNYVLSKSDGSLDKFEFELLKGFDKKTVAHYMRTAVGDKIFADELLESYSKTAKSHSKTKRRKIEIKKKNKNEILEFFRSNSLVFNDFINSKLCYSKLKGIATNLFPFQGTKEFIINRMNEFNSKIKEIESTDLKPYIHDDFRLVEDLYRVGYLPMNLKIHFNDKYSNFLEIFKLPRKLKVVNLISRDEAEKRLDTEIQKFFQNPKPNKVTILRAEVGLGKTTSLIKHIKDADCLIGFPDHNLKNEKAEKLDELGIEYHITKGIPDDIDPNLKEYIDSCLRVGDIRYANRMIHNHIKENEDSSDAIKLKEYFENNEKALHAEGITLTTHAKLIYSDTSKNIIISDEDLINQLFQIQTITWKDFFVLKGLVDSQIKGDPSKLFQDQLNTLNGEANFNKVFRTSISCLENDELEEIKNLINDNRKLFNGPVAKFIQSEYCIRTGIEGEYINFMNLEINQLHPHKSYLILSATANEFIYRLLERYGFEVEFIEIPNASHNSTIYQDLTYSNSQSSLKARQHFESYVEAVNSLEVPVITHLGWKEHFKHAEPSIHFNKCSGYDKLKGKDIAVIGAIHRPPYSYALMACCFTESFIGTELPKAEMIEIESRAGFFRYKSFDNNTFRMLQQHFIEEALIQAIGRTRYLRENINIYLLSNYLITPQFKQITLKDTYREKVSDEACSDTQSEPDEE